LTRTREKCFRRRTHTIGRNVLIPFITLFAFRENIIAAKPEAQAAKMAQVQDFIGVT